MHEQIEQSDSPGKLLREQDKLLELVTSGASPEDCLLALVTAAEKLVPQISACILVTDESAEGRVVSSFSNFASPDFALGLTTPPDMEADAFADDKKRHSKWCDLFRQYGIRVCRSQPVLSAQGTALGWFMLCLKEPRQPYEEETGIAGFGTRIASIVLERERASLLLKNTEEQFRTWIEQVRDHAIFRTDLDALPVTWNEGVRNVLGFEEDEFINHKINNLIFTPEDIQESVPEKEMEEACREGSANNDRWMRRKDGSYIWIMGATYKVLDPQKNHVGYSKVMRDETQWKLAEDALKQSEERLRLAVEGARIGYWTYDPQKQQVTLDERCSKQLDVYSPQSSNPDAVLKNVPAEDRELIGSTFKKAVRGSGPYSVEFRVQREDGTTKWIVGKGNAVKDAVDRSVKYTGITLDISDRKKLEQEKEQLLQSERAARQEAERAGRLKDEFLTTLSHELRTPLNSVLGWAQVLKRNKALNEDLRSGLDAIDRNARSQAKLIEDLLDMSRIISGKIRLDIKPLNVAELVNEAVEAIRPTADSKGIRIEARLDHQSTQIKADANRVQQIVWNLLTNAVKFTPDGGTVTVEVNERSHDSSVEITVSDTGRGISPSFLPYIFQRFRQEDSSTTRKHSGLGIGLSIVKHLVQLHGGVVTAESEGENMGSLFRVVLPTNQNESGNRTEDLHQPLINNYAPPVSTCDLHGIKVLIVDDDKDSREIVDKVLKDRGAVTILANSAQEGFSLLRKEKPSLLVSDIAMPETDGYEFIRNVRSSKVKIGVEIPAIALTAFARTEDKNRALEAGFQAHVAKPVEPNELLTVVAQMTGRC